MASPKPCKRDKFWNALGLATKLPLPATLKISPSF